MEFPLLQLGHERICGEEAPCWSATQVMKTAQATASLHVHGQDDKALLQKAEQMAVCKSKKQCASQQVAAPTLQQQGTDRETAKGRAVHFSGH